MILYHFTRAANEHLITQDGIKAGNFPFRERVSLSLVSLTAHLCAQKHGLLSGQKVMEGSRAFGALSPIFPSLVSGLAPAREMNMHDQTQVAIQVDVSEADISLLDIWKFAEMADVYLKTNIPKLLIAAALATADFPCNDASELQLDSQTREYLDPDRLNQEILTRGWYFYKGDVAASMVKGVLHRKNDGSYAP